MGHHPGQGPCIPSSAARHSGLLTRPALGGAEAGTTPPVAPLSVRASGARPPASWEADCTTAQAAYAAAPADPTACQETQPLLLQPDQVAALGTALRAGLVWAQYGEQSIYWFHHVARERQAQTHIPALYSGADPSSPLITLDSPACRQQVALPILVGFFSGASLQGLFAVRPVCAAAQDELPAAVDQRLTPAAIAAREGELGDGSISAAELEAPCARCLAARRRAWAVSRTRSTCASGESRAASSPPVLQEAFSSADSPALPGGMLQGRITL